MSDTASRIPDDMKTAMKAKDAVTLQVLRALKTALTNFAIEKGGMGTPLEEAETLAIIRKQIKQRQDSIEQFDKAGRTELADKEREEITVLERYLPAPLSSEEIEEIVAAAIAETGATGKADMGKVMKVVQERCDGRADGKTLSQAIMKRLS